MKVIGTLTKDAIIRAAVSEGLTVTQVIGTAVDFDTDTQTYLYASVVHDPDQNKIIIAYRDNGNSNKGTAIVGTVSGTSISFGTPVVFYDGGASGQSDFNSIVYDSSNNKVVISFRGFDGSGSTCQSIVGTVSGTSISFGTAVTFSSDSANYMHSTFDSNSNRVVVVFRDQGNSSYGTAIVGTVSGTSISFGSEVVFESATTSYPQCVFDSSNNKVVVAYQDEGNSDYGTAIVGTVSGTSISFGTPVVYHSARADKNKLAFDSTNNKVVIAFRDNGDNEKGKALVGTVSGTSISFGSTVTFSTSGTRIDYSSLSYNVAAQKVIVTYRQYIDASAVLSSEINEGTVSGTSISFGSSIKFADRADWTASVYDSTSESIVIAFQDYTDSKKGAALVFQSGYSQATGGTIADGKAVIVNANGTVSTISQTAASIGTKSAFNSITSSFFAPVFDSSNNKHIIVYRTQPNMRYVVATVASDGSVSYGTDAVVLSGDHQQIAAAFDSTNNRVVIVFRNGNDSSHGYAMVGSLSGTTVTWGSATEFQNAGATGLGISFDSTAGKVVIGYRGTSNYGRVRVGTVSGTSISFGTEVVFNSASTNKVRPVYDSTNDKTVITYRDDGNSSYGTAIVGTVSGTSISFGSEVVFESASVSHLDAAFDSDNGKVVVAYRDDGNSNDGTAIVGTVSGTSISFGAPVVFDDDGDYGENTDNSMVYDTNAQKILVVYPRTVSGSYSNRGFVFPLSVSGTTVVADTPTNFDGSSYVSYPAISFDSNVNKSLISFPDGANEYANTASFAPLSGNLTSENFVGFMKGAALDGTNGEILSSCSIARNQTSLTPGQTYFVSPTDGSLSTSAGSPSVTAGTAISSTELIVKG